jgi:hypothetical protein
MIGCARDNLHRWLDRVDSVSLLATPAVRHFSVVTGPRGSGAVRVAIGIAELM